MKKSATSREASSEKTTVSAISPNTCPAMPSTNTMGKNTAIVVRVEAKTAPPTSETPRMVAALRSSPSSWQRKMLSSTTIELSTSMPIPSASPPREMMLSETSLKYMGANVATTETGIVMLIMNVFPSFLRNR